MSVPIPICTINNKILSVNKKDKLNIIPPIIADNAKLGKTSRICSMYVYPTNLFI